MASTTKRAWKLQEFPAHTGNVNCLALGHKSGRVMVTGGEDKKVNLWAVGQAKCIYSLSGHTSPVEAVRFGSGEEMVVAGSLSGAIKIWDLDAIKILRTLSGHKSSIKSIDFHPYGDFVASGSLDTNIKLWDIRRKGCIFTYKGHTNCVNCIRFSPDGRWMASGGEDGILKLWDLTAGKQLTEFRQHTGPITSTEFHPNELFLATGSADRTVKFWDLESLQLVSSTDGDSTAIRTLFFHPEGNCLYAGAMDHLKVFGWEPSRCFDSLTIGWGKPADISVAQNQLIGASLSQSMVSVYVADIQRIQPLGGPPYQQPSDSQPPASTQTNHTRRKSFLLDRPTTQCTAVKNNDRTSLAHEPTNHAATHERESDEPEPIDYEKVFQPMHEISRETPRQPVQPFPAPPEDAFSNPVITNRQSVGTKQSSQTSSPAKPDSASCDKDSCSTARSQHPYVPPEAKTKRPPTSSTKTTRAAGETAKDSRTRFVRPSADDMAADVKPARYVRHMSEDRSASRDRPAPNQDNDLTKFRAVRANADFQNSPADRDRFSTDRMATDQDRLTSDDIINSNRAYRSASDTSNAKCFGNVDVDDFLLKQCSGELDDETAMSSICGGHSVLMTVLSTRHRSLQVIKTLWTAGNVKTAMESALSMNDPAILHDVVNMMLQKTSAWNLDTCACVLPILSDLITSKYDTYLMTGINGVKFVLRGFASIIKDNISGFSSVGVDITREERYNKSLSCHKILMKIRSELDRKPNTNSQRSMDYKEIQLLMNQLD